MTDPAAPNSRSPFRLVLVNSTDCTVGGDFAAMAEAAGWTIERIALRCEGREEEWSGYQSWMQLVEELVEFAPDAVMSIDRRGISGAAPLIFLCEVLRLPLLVWYADNPFYLVPQMWECEMDCLASLVFDSAFVEPLREWGMRHVEHLALGTNPVHFDVPAIDPSERTYDISFVASTGIDRIRAILAELEHAMQGTYGSLASQVQALVEDGGRWLAGNPLGSPFDFLNERGPKAGDLQPWIERQWPRALLASLIDFQATFSARLEAAKRLLALGLHVWGDPAWANFIPTDRFHGPIQWEKIQDVYANSRLVLNVSRYQLVSSVTQRHFDVPLCGAVLLTDSRPGLAEYYEPGAELIVYKDLDDLEAKASEALDNAYAGQLAEINRRARQTTLARHTYAHRLGAIERAARTRREDMDRLGGASLDRQPALVERCLEYFEPWLEQGERRLLGIMLDRLAAETPRHAVIEAWRARLAE